MSERLRDIGWIVAFLALCAAWISEVTRATHRAELKRDGFSSNRHPALGYCRSMMFSENRYPLFGIML
jgi:hypothetical protein